MYPIFGQDFDPRDLDATGKKVVGWQWRHIGGTARRFGDNINFFNGSVPHGMYGRCPIVLVKLSRTLLSLNTLEYTAASEHTRGHCCV